MGKEEGAKINDEIESMLTALGDPTPEILKVDEEGDENGEADVAAAEAKKKEEEEAEAARIAAENNEGETEEEKAAREKQEADDAAAALANKKEDVNEETDKDKIIENLRAQLNEKSEIPTENKMEKSEKDESKKVEPLKFEEQDFIGDLDLDDLVRDKVAFNKILNAVYAKGVNDSKQIATEGVLNSIPDLVRHNVDLYSTLKEVSDNFYKENNDLTPFKRVVAAVFEEISAASPDKTYAELMKLTAPEVRKRLELHKQAVKNTPTEDKGKPPRLPGVKSGQRQTPSEKPSTSAIEKEISEMNSTLRR